MRGRVRAARKSLVAVVTLLVSIGAAAQAPEHALTSVYLEGKPVPFVPGAADKAHKLERLGPWTLGPRPTESKPLDKRLNLYLVFPGKQYTSEASEYDHNVLVNAPPKREGAEIEWDVFYCFVLDPHLRDDLVNERDVLLLAAQRWTPGDLFEFDDMPSTAGLRELKKADAFADLAKWRRKDGTLPRVVILPAGFAVRGALTIPAEPKPSM